MGQRSTITSAHHVLAGAALEKVFERLEVDRPWRWLADAQSRDYSQGGPSHPYGIVLTYIFHMYGDLGRQLRVDVRFAPLAGQQPMDCEVDGVKIYIKSFFSAAAIFEFKDELMVRSEVYHSDLNEMLSDSSQIVVPA